MVLAVMGILASIALPSYSAHVRQSVARQGALCLLGYSLLQERWRVASGEYQPAEVLLTHRSLPTRVRQHYSLFVDLSGPATGFALSLEPTDPSAGYPVVRLESTGLRTPASVWP